MAVLMLLGAPQPLVSVVRAAQPTQVSVSVERGAGATYAVGERLTACVRTGRPALVVVSNFVDGALFARSDPVTVAGEACFTATITPPVGQETLRAELVEAGRVVATAEVHYRSVLAAASPGPGGGPSTPRPDSPRPDTPRPDSPEPDAPRPDMPRSDPPQGEPARPGGSPTPRQLTEVLDSAVDPAWSPDGRRVAFQRRERGGAHRIYIVDAGGGSPTPVTGPDLIASTPSWSRDGRIVFVCRRGGVTQICVVNADGTGLVQVTQGPGTRMDPAWSPDGRIAFTLATDQSTVLVRTNIVVVNADGSGLTRLTAADAADGQAAWSPDGSRLAFIRRDYPSFRVNVHVMNADGSDVRRLTDAPGDSASPTWSPDGSRLAFARVRDLYVMRADGSGLTRLTDAAADGSIENGAPAWSPAGATLAYQRLRTLDVLGNRSYQIWALDVPAP